MAVGVDIGATEIVACVPGDATTQLVRAFGTYTVDLQAIGQWFCAQGIATVAMESTGVYWIPLFETLEAQGFTCLLISARALRRVPGKKSDITDALWIQTLHQYGLLVGSFRPEGELVALRTNAVHLEMNCLLAQIELLQHQVNQLEATLTSLMAEIPQHINSIPEIGLATGAALLSEIGDVRRFASAQKLVGYAGIDPSVYQTGEFEAQETHMSKRGSPYLRHAL
jgi:transposase